MPVHRGESVAPGIAVGPVYLQGYEDQDAFAKRIPADQVEHELNRLREALNNSRRQIEEIKQKQAENLGQNELRIFDTHIAYLSDPLFVSEIEKLVLEERFSARESIRSVVEKYDRIFQLVESDHLRQRASDFRDVATRLMRNLEGGARLEEKRGMPAGPYVLAAHKLTTTDMFNLENEQVDGIVAEEGGISSHAAILARSMGIPTITGIRDLPRLLQNGDLVILDAGTGELQVNPDERILAEFTESAQRWRSARVQAPPGSLQHTTRDGTEVTIMGACGNVGEVDLAHTFEMDGIGLFRTELLFLVEKEIPSEDKLVHLYRQVMRKPAGGPVRFRLLDVSAAALPYTPLRAAERNPAMGMRGARQLLQRQSIMRLQLRAILRAGADTEKCAVLVPFVTGLSELQRVKAAILEERLALRKRGVPCASTLLVAPIIEVPAAAYVLSAFLNDSDFAVVAVDDLQAHMLAADRDNVAVREYYEMLHPALFELLARMSKEAERKGKELMLFGESAADPRRMPFYIGVGYRSFAVAPVRLNGVLKMLRRYTVDECRKIAMRVLDAPRSLDVQRVLVNLKVD